MRAKKITCHDCGKPYMADKANLGTHRLCEPCRPKPKAIKVEPESALIEIGCLAEILSVDDNFMIGMSSRHFGGARAFTPEQVDDITRRVHEVAV